MNYLRHVCFTGRPVSTTRAAGEFLARSPSPRFSPVSSPVEPVAQANPFLDWLLRRAQLDPANYRLNALQRRIPATLRVLQVRDETAAKQLLLREPNRLEQALSALLIGVTSFFRDAAVFDDLRRWALPNLLAERDSLRVCSLGCSTGQELYSVAILLEEIGALSKCSLLGVDCRQEAIDKAIAGAYDPAETRELPAALRHAYFLPIGKHAVVKSSVRSKVFFHLGSVATFPTSRPWDLVLFRNVAIYLAPNAAAPVWERLSRHIVPGGLLVTGKAERPPAGSPFRRLAPCVYEKLHAPVI